jgi:hypothetical protein
MHYEGCHDIAEILLKVVLNTNQSINHYEEKSKLKVTQYKLFVYYNYM